MRKSKFTDEQIAFALKQSELGISVELCSGPCLRFSWHAGWTVAASTAPSLDPDNNVTRMRLFEEGRPRFILFAVATGWCARLVSVAIEVHDAEPWTAIDTLRIAYGQYAKLQVQRGDLAPCIEPT